MRTRRTQLRVEQGFTVVETMVAMVVVVVGMIGAASLLSKASETTSSTKAREGGVALQRELVEAARSVPYSELVPTGVVGKLQAQAGLADSGTEAGWNVTRRGIQYTIAVGVCSVDDTADGTAPHPADTFCANGGGAATSANCRTLLGTTGSIQGTGAAVSAGALAGDCGIDLDLDGEVDNLLSITATTAATVPQDQNPEDYKRVVTLVRWATGVGSRFALQSTTLPNPGLSGAPRVTTLTASSTLVTSSTVTSLSFTAQTNRMAEAVGWLLDGTPSGAASGNDTTTFTWAWNLGSPSAGTSPSAGEVVDGEYTVSAKAFDSFGAFGPQRAQTIVLNRRLPYAPQNFKSVMVDDVVEVEWTRAPERDIQGFRVYRRPPSGSDVQIADIGDHATEAQDGSNLPASGIYSYFARAVDKDTAGNLRTGDATSLIPIRFDNRSPRSPSNVTAQRVGAQVNLSWSAPADPVDPDAGDSVAGYVIYRDGQRLADSYATTTSTTYTDTAVSDGEHTYWIVAVDGRGAQSARVAANEVTS